MKHGLIAGMASVAGGEAIMEYAGNASRAVKVALNSVVAGTASELGGGKFTNGAMTGAFTMMFNHLMHQKFTDKQLKKIYEAYRNDVEDYKTPKSFYKHIGGPLGEWAENSPEEFGNTCAARLSRALNYSGFEIPKGTAGAYLGGDGKYYFINAKQMANYLSKDTVWGTPTLLGNNQTVKNAVIFQTGFAGGVTGHLDVVYRGQAAHEIYDTKTYYWH